MAPTIFNTKFLNALLMKVGPKIVPTSVVEIYNVECSTAVDTIVTMWAECSEADSTLTLNYVTVHFGFHSVYGLNNINNY